MKEPSRTEQILHRCFPAVNCGRSYQQFLFFFFPNSSFDFMKKTREERNASKKHCFNTGAGCETNQECTTCLHCISDNKMAVIEDSFSH